MERSLEIEETMLSSTAQEDSEMDARCRIVVVSSSIETAKVFVERVISLSDNKTSNGGTTEKERLSDKDEGEEVVVIPHTLRNRYYEADVWFWVVGVEKLKRELGGAGKDEEDGGFGRFYAGDGAFDSEDEEEEVQHGGMSKAPAMVYVWDDSLGMSRCRREIGEVVRGMKRSGWDGEEGGEVCLAVRMGGGGEEGDGEVDVDGMFMEHGFEYVDGREKEGLRRVIDALSTVMWASMRSNSDARRVSGKGREEEEEMMSELLDIAVRRDAEEEEEFGEKMSSPVDMDMLSPFGFEAGAGVRRKVSMGFEDDFVQSAGYVALDEEEPSQEEIEQTASRIFGGDLSSVFLSLQGLKGEIAAMEDEGERRRMAARVAMGLAYAFDLE